METLIAFREWVMDWLDPIGVVVGILIAVPVFWTWWDVVFGARRRRRRWFREARSAPGETPAILIVDLLSGRDVRASVERFRGQQEALREVPADRVVLVARVERLGPDDMPDLHTEVRAAAGRQSALPLNFEIGHGRAR